MVSYHTFNLFILKHGRSITFFHKPAFSFNPISCLYVSKTGQSERLPFMYKFGRRFSILHFRFCNQTSNIQRRESVKQFAFLGLVLGVVLYVFNNNLFSRILRNVVVVLITGVLTDAIKDATGRPRPDFFWRCFPDGIDEYDPWGNVICHGEEGDIREGHKSFPSGHSSWSFAGLGFLALYLAGKIKAFDRGGHVVKLCIVFLPLLMASLVAISRVDDYWHHWQDVFAGGLLGLTVATFCSLQFFPAPYHSEGWGPYAYFLALEESRSNI